LTEVRWSKEVEEEVDWMLKVRRGVGVDWKG